MNFSDEQILIKPGHETRHWQSADYTVHGTWLFHERTYVRTRPFHTRHQELTPGVAFWLASGPAVYDSTQQWLDVHGHRDLIEDLAKKHGGRAMEEFYSEDPDNPNYFLAFDDTDVALAFCRTEDFDKHCLTFDKL